MTTTQSTAQRRWLADVMNAARALEPFALTHPEGFEYIGPEAPKDLARLYRDLVSVGYARGWMP